ncbi:MAG TPA: DUF1801 domain-containing protein [Bacteroidota bacterium]
MQKRQTGKERSVKQYLKKFPKPVQALTTSLRRLIKQAVPACIERVYPGWKLIGYRAINGTKSHYFGFLFPSKEHVVLGFEYGTMLSDPQRVLEGSGTQVRYVTIRSQKDIRKTIFVPLIVEAMSIALERKKGKR